MESNRVVVITTYEAEGPDELSIREGERLTVTQKHPNGWWVGRTQVRGRGLRRDR